MVFIGSAYEHDSIHKELDVTVKTIEELEEVLQQYPDDTKIVFWMLTNNISGIMYKTKEIGELCHKYGAYYIMDCTASIKNSIIWHKYAEGFEDYCDCLITSAHKYGGPKGIGFMWISDRLSRFMGLLDSPKDEYGTISGTPDVASAMAMSRALENCCGKNNEDYNYLCLDLYYYLRDQLDKSGISYFAVSDKQDKCVYTLGIASFVLYNPDTKAFDIDAKALQAYLASKNIYIGVGASACAEDEDYRVLKAYNLSDEEARSTIRISFSDENTREDIDELVKEIVKFKELYV